MSKLNYHHLYYFWHVAKQGNLTKTAANLHISQSALSSQIRQLESNMGVELFIREGRKLRLTENGQNALAYAEEIFTRGEELESLLSKGIQQGMLTVRIGVLTTMSRNFVESFIEPLIRRPNTKYILHARGQVNLLNALANHEFDLALTNTQVLGVNKELWQCQLLARQPVAIIGPPKLSLGKVFQVVIKSMNGWCQLPIVQYARPLIVSVPNTSLSRASLLRQMIWRCFGYWHVIQVLLQ